MARTTAVLIDGKPTYVGEGAVRQQGPKKLYQCNACGREVVWLTSKRTSGVYLADVYSGASTRYYISRPHNCKSTVDAAPAPAEAIPEPSYRDQADDEFTRRFLAGEMTRSEYVAAITALEDLFAQPLGD